jgi:membrane associated rhomboid family serine protease
MKGNRRVLWCIIGANTVVFGAWQYAAIPAGTRSPNFQVLKVLNKHFLTSLEAIKSGRYWTALTCAFSHVSVGHFLGNMISMYAFASVLTSIYAITPLRLVTLTCGSAIAGSVGFYLNEANKQGGSRRSALGASGAVMGLGSAAAILAPRATMLLYGIVPIPLWAIVAGYFVFDSYYLNDPLSRTGHAGHLGGLAFGAAYTLLKLRAGRLW